MGSGAFGRVLKAEASGILSSEAVSTVAVKMVKPQADITYMKALMAELKIMIHIGKHLNIVNLLGASTVRLSRRELLVIVEYCRFEHHVRDQRIVLHHTRFGNIQKYLIHHRNKFINQVDPNTGIINFTIGRDLLGVTSAGEEIDWPTQRERGESSAHYLTSGEETGGDGGGYLGKRPQSSRPAGLNLMISWCSHGVSWPGHQWEERREGEECEVHQGALPPG